MKINVKKTVEVMQEIEVKVPCYTKKSFSDGETFRVYWIKSKNEVVSIDNDGFIDRNCLANAFGESFEIITKDEFLTYLKKTQILINKIKNEN